MVIVIVVIIGKIVCIIVHIGCPKKTYRRPKKSWLLNGST